MLLERRFIFAAEEKIIAKSHLCRAFRAARKWEWQMLLGTI